MVDTHSPSEQSSAELPQFEPIKVDAISNSKKTNGKKTSDKSTKNSTSLATWILLILVLISLAASGFLWQQLNFVMSDQVKKSSYQLEMQKKTQSIEELQTALEAAQSQIITAESDLQNLLQEQQKIKTQIAGISGVNRIDWLIDELQHLTRLAHQRLLLSHDAQGTIALLKAADQVAIEMRQSSALAIRQAIAADLLNLQMAANVDLEGAYIRLDSLTAKIEELNFKTPNYPSQSIIQENVEQNEAEIYYAPEFGDKVANAFSHILTKLQPYLYRSFRVDGEVKPLMSGDEREYFSRNMVMAIEQAQLALLRREAESYRLSLEQSEKWIKQYYDSSDPLTTSVLAIIEELKSYRLNPKMPEINRTLDAVSTFSENWQLEKIDKQQVRRSLAQ